MKRKISDKLGLLKMAPTEDGDFTFFPHPFESELLEELFLNLYGEAGYEDPDKMKKFLIIYI